MFYYELVLNGGRAARKSVFATKDEATEALVLESRQARLTVLWHPSGGGFLVDERGRRRGTFLIRRVESSFCEYVVQALDSGETTVVFGTLERFAAERGLVVDGATIRNQNGTALFSTVKM